MISLPSGVNSQASSPPGPAGGWQLDAVDVALAEEKIAALVNGAEPRRVIVVPGRLVNVVL